MGTEISGLQFTNPATEEALAPKAVARFKEGSGTHVADTGYQYRPMVHDLAEYLRDGSAISDDAKQRKCSPSWRNGSDVDFVRLVWNNGNEEPRAIENSAARRRCAGRAKTAGSSDGRGTLPKPSAEHSSANATFARSAFPSSLFMVS